MLTLAAISYLAFPKEIMLDYIIACVSLVDTNFNYAFIFDDAVKLHLLVIDEKNPSLISPSLLNGRGSCLILMQMLVRLLSCLKKSSNTF